MNLYPSHRAELEASKISPAIIERYFSSVEGQAAQDYLIESAMADMGAHSQQYVTSGLRFLLDQSEHAKAGGWVCSANGQIKPDKPRQATIKADSTGDYRPEFNKDGSPKLIKYESIREKPYQGAYIQLMRPVEAARKTATGQSIVIITEGAKKAAAAVTLGYLAVPLPGVDMGTFRQGLGNPELIPVLAGLVTGDYALVVAFDQDKVLAKRRGVAGSVARLAETLESSGADVSVAVWGHKAGKGIDDIFAAKGADFVHQAIGAAATLKTWKTSLPKTWLNKPKTPAYKAELNRIEAMHQAFNAKPKADITLNQRYLDKGTLPAPGSILLVDSPMNTGKTSSLMAGLVAQQRAEHPEAIGISSAYRNILLRQSGAALGFTHWLDTDGDPDLSKFGYLAACPESLPKLANQKIPNGSIILIDEIVAWLAHIHCSDTMKNGVDRVTVLNAVKTLLEKVLDADGYVVGLEANIPQWAVDCMKDLAPKGTAFSFMRNEFQIKTNQKAFLYETLTHFKTVQSQMFAEGVRIVAASDSATQIDLQYRPMFNSAKCFHISSSNSSDPEAQLFAENPQADLLSRGGLDFLGYSPTLGNGSSIDDIEGSQWFDVKTGLFTHLTSAAAAQQLERYRAAVPAHIFVQSAGNGIGDGDLSLFTPEGIRARWNDEAEYFHKLVNIAAYLADGLGDSLAKTLERSLAGEIPAIASLDKWRSTITAIENFDKLHLAENLEKRLIERGYKIVKVEKVTDPGASELFKQTKKDAEAKLGAEFAALTIPETLTPEEARTILSTHGHTKAQALEAKKCLYSFEFPECDFDNAAFCTKWLIESRGKKLSKIRAEWAARNPEQAKALDRWHLKGKLKQAKNLSTGVSMSDVIHRSPQADVFAKAKLPEAIDAIGCEPYGENHPEVQRVAKWAESNQPVLKSVFRMRLSEDRNALDIFNAFSRLIGYEPQQDKKKGSGRKEKREKTYVLSDFANPDRGHMLKALSDKFTAKLEQKGESLEGKPVQVVSDWGVSNEQLAQRQAAKAPEPIPAAQPSEATQPELTSSAGWAWQMFEADLIDAQTIDELKLAKARADESLRREVMAAWAADGRYQWLSEKAAKLAAV